MTGQQVEHVVEEPDAGAASRPRRCRRGSARRCTCGLGGVALDRRRCGVMAASFSLTVRGLHRLGVHLEALGAGDRGPGGGELPGAPAPICTSAIRRRKWRGESAGGEAGGAGRSGARGWSRRRSRRRRSRWRCADEQAPGAADERGEGLGLGSDQLQVLGRERVGQRDRLARGRGRRRSPKAASPTVGRSSDEPLELDGQRVEHTCSDGADGDRPGCRRRARPGRAGRGRRARARAGRRRGRARRAGRWARRSRRSRRRRESWRLASCTYRLPGPDDHVDAVGRSRCRRRARRSPGRRPCGRRARRRTAGRCRGSPGGCPRRAPAGRRRRRRAPRRRGR